MYRIYRLQEQAFWKLIRQYIIIQIKRIQYKPDKCLGKAPNSMLPDVPTKDNFISFNLSRKINNFAVQLIHLVSQYKVNLLVSFICNGLHI
jgi:hypothetical protein